MTFRLDFKRHITREALRLFSVFGAAFVGNGGPSGPAGAAGAAGGVGVGGASVSGVSGSTGAVSAAGVAGGSGAAGVMGVRGPALPAGTPLLTWSGGQFNRRQDASVVPTYLTSAFTYARGVADTLRLEDTGDGNGALLLIEGQRKCINIKSTTINTWTPLNGPPVATPDTDISPEGIQNADSVAYTASSISRMSQTVTAANVTSSKNLAFQAWAKSAAAQKWRFLLVDKSAGNQVSADLVTSSTWTRYTFDHDSGAGAGNPVFILENASDAAARTIIFAGVCVEEAAFPSSLILNDTAAQLGIRYPDILVFTPELVPAHFCTGKWDDGFRFKGGTADMVSGDVDVLYSWGDANNVLRVRHNGTDVRLEAVIGGSIVASSGAATWAREAYVPAIVDLPTGTLTLNGAAGAPAGAIAFPRGVPVRVGGIVGGAAEAFAGFRGPKVAA